MEKFYKNTASEFTILFEEKNYFRFASETQTECETIKSEI